MLSLLGLLVRLLVASRRTLAGWVVYLAGLGVLYAVPGPLDELYVATSVALVAVTIWIVVSGFISDRPTTMMLCAAAGGSLRFHLLQTAAGLAAALPLAVIAVAAGRLVAGSVLDRPEVVALGVSTHVVALLVGAGIGSVAALPVMRDVAFSLTAAVGGFVLVAVAPGVSPLSPVLGNVTSAADSLGAAAAWCLAAAGWAAVLAVVAGAVAGRRRSYGIGRSD